MTVTTRVTVLVAVAGTVAVRVTNAVAVAVTVAGRVTVRVNAAVNSRVAVRVRVARTRVCVRVPPMTLPTVTHWMCVTVAVAVRVTQGR